jgi:hypothetical protein
VANRSVYRFRVRGKHGVAPTTPRETYERIKETNPLVAARYAIEHNIHDSESR